MLEVLAQILAVVTLADHVGEDWIAFIDNAAGQWALNKGYGGDASVNGLLSALAAMRSWRPAFHRVQHRRPEFSGGLHSGPPPWLDAGGH